MPTDRLRAWMLALSVTIIGGVLRFVNLGYASDGGTPTFDEKHYVPQAWQYIRNGGYEDNPGYELVVHPPLGKMLIGASEWLFGYSPTGWRVASAACGTLMIFAIFWAARRLTRSTFLGVIAAVLLICDGVVHVQSRLGMLDIFQATTVLLTFWFLLMDRDQMRSRLVIAVNEGWIHASPYGPRLGFRWWRFATGVGLGLTCAVKWNGLYWVVAFGLLTVLFDATARRAAGVTRPWVGALRLDTLPGIWNLVVVAILTYLATWWGWLGSETGIERHVVGGYAYKGTGIGAGGPFSFVPDALRDLWYYSGNVLQFHDTLDTPRNAPHPWESKPWTWFMGLRPMLYLYHYGSDVVGCGESSCVTAQMLVGTPAMWWLAFPMIGWSLWRILTKFDWRYVAVMVPYLMGILPWFLNINRQMYFFYMTPLSAFLVLGIVLCLGEIMGSAKNGFERRRTGLLVVALYVGLVVANFVWLWPILNGEPITYQQWQNELWLPSWR
jgi:dolichyl-phosphate-mannose--protein O-mannosyl transferase